MNNTQLMRAYLDACPEIPEDNKAIMLHVAHQEDLDKGNILPWVIIHGENGETDTVHQLVCGECFEANFDWRMGIAIKDHAPHYSSNCSVCGKNCGDHFHRK